MTDKIMDPQLWGNLHHHVGLEKVFVKLPFRKFFQARVVCKEWNRLAADEKFLKESYARSPVPWPHFCVMHPDGDWQIILAYNEATDEWQQMPIPLPYKKGYRANWVDGILHISCPGSNDDIDGVESVKNVVFDLRTRMQHILPPHYVEEHLVGYKTIDSLVVINPGEGAFQVVSAVEDEHGAGHTSIYCSETKSWKLIRPQSHLQSELKPRCKTSRNFSSSICCGNILYTCSKGSDYNSITMYDLASGNWSRLALPSSYHCHLGVYQERVYAVSYDTYGNFHVPVDYAGGYRPVRVHLLRQPDAVWEEVAFTPKDLSRQLFETNDPEFGSSHELQCVFQGKHVEASFCEQFVHIAVFLQDYHVMCQENQHHFWVRGKWVPRRFCLYNLATRKWKYVSHPFSTGRERIEEL